ncbi:hypothetical protein K151_3389 [Proteus hauseri ZMd44]|nr:hypothetical protein K151_3389 [Proteus hauseri ZMd44]
MPAQDAAMEMSVRKQQRDTV